MSKEITLALSGGGMRGCAHIGVIKRIEELKLQIKAISGTSVGATIGALNADGFSAEEIEEIVLKSNFGFDFNFFHFREALFNSKRLENMLKKNLRSKKFGELKTQLTVCVTNFRNGNPEYLTDGDLIPALLASSAIPMLYKPVTINDTDYIDGGVRRNLPTEPLLIHNLPIIGVHVNPLLNDFINKRVKEKLDHVIHMLLLENLEKAIKQCSIFIEPEKLLRYSVFETKQIREMIGIGYEKAKLELNENRLLSLF